MGTLEDGARIRRETRALMERSAALKAKSVELFAELEDEIDRTRVICLGIRSKGQPVKDCGCGLEHTFQGWMCLPSAGYHRFPNARGEMRHCPCGSTILLVTWRVERSGPVPVQWAKAPGGDVRGSPPAGSAEVVVRV